MANCKLLVVNILLFIQLQYVIVYAFDLAQSNPINVQDPSSPVGVAVDSPAKMTFYINGPGRVRVLLPIDIEVIALRNFREQYGITTRIPNGVYVNGQPRPSAVLPYAPPAYRWNPRPIPFPVLGQQYNRSPMNPSYTSPYYNAGSQPPRVVLPGIPATQHPIEATTTISATTTSDSTAVATTVASSLIVEDTTPAAAAATLAITIAAPTESIALDEFSLNHPINAERINGNGELPSGDSGPHIAPISDYDLVPIIDDDTLRTTTIATTAASTTTIAATIPDPIVIPSAFPVDDVRANEEPPPVSFK